MIVLQANFRVLDGTRINTVEGKKTVKNNCIEFTEEKNAKDLLRGNANWSLVSGMDYKEDSEETPLTIENTKPEELINLGKKLSKNVVISDEMADDDQNDGDKPNANTQQKQAESGQGDANKSSDDKGNGDGKEDEKKSEDDSDDEEDDDDDKTKDDGKEKTEIDQLVESMNKDELVKFAKENKLPVPKLGNGTPKYKTLRQNILEFVKNKK